MNSKPIIPSIPTMTSAPSVGASHPLDPADGQTPLRPRRAFLADLGMGFTGLALGTLLQREARAASSALWTPPDGRPHFTPKAKNVIWLFMNGGVSHIESFDPKPMLTKYAGKTIAETPFASVQDPKKLALERLVVPDANGNPSLARSPSAARKMRLSGPLLRLGSSQERLSRPSAVGRKSRRSTSSRVCITIASSWKPSLRSPSTSR